MTKVNSGFKGLIHSSLLTFSEIHDKNTINLVKYAILKLYLWGGGGVSNYRVVLLSCYDIF